MSSRLPSTRPTTRRERIKRNEAIKHKDDIFLDKNSPTKFEFDSGVAMVFDDMLERSVPLYRECQNLTVSWCKRLATPDKCIYDLGCSTGSLLLLLAKSICLCHLDYPQFALPLAGNESKEMRPQYIRTTFF